LRDFLDSILVFIGSETLVDLEFNSLPSLSQEYSKEVYEALKVVLESRENVSGQTKKLKNFFLAKGVNITEPAYKPASNILIGEAL
jgi:TRAP-type C4-dicarboxylate transport system substrate-binding protein